MTPANLGPVTATCCDCGFRYYEYNGHIIACPVCALSQRPEASATRAGVVVPRALAVNIVNNLAIQNSQYSHTLANQLQTILAAAAL